MTPVKAIREKCKDCSADELAEIRNCSFKDCSLYPYRMGKRPTGTGTTPMKAIRKRCLECCDGQPQEVRLCPSTQCPVWEYRLGRKPK